MRPEPEIFFFDKFFWKYFSVWNTVGKI